MAVSKCPGCGGAVPDGANFCPACGLALGDRERPRQGPHPWIEFLDKAWDFFASTKVAAWLIVAIAVASIAGSLIEQESLYQDWRPPYLYYPARYGEFWGNLYMRLGLTHAYSSIWYAALVLMIVLSLIICSLQRLVPLHRTLMRPQVWKLPHFLKRQEVVVEAEGDLALAEAKLKRAGYKLLRERECLYGDKGRLSRYGPYIIHIGLLVVCFAAFAKGLPGWDQTADVWIPDGQTAMVPGTDFAITNHKFTMDLYENGMPSRFATDASIVVGEQEVLRKTIEVNKPLSYGGWDIYQASWREEPGVAHLKVMDAANKRQLASIAFDLRQPEAEYPIAGTNLKLVVRSYLHDFMVDPETNQPTNASFEVRNPVLLSEFVTADKQEVVGRAALMILGKTPPVYEGALYLEVERVEQRWFTALKLHRDRTVPYMFAGLTIVMLGMGITFFIFHWQVWVREEQGRLLIGARAYKNKFGLKQEMKRLFGAPHGEGN
ncbi:MAG: cytochrome c biogenesis protein ResB [Bacillota bacterium]